MPADGGFAFGPFLLDPRAKRLTRDAVDVPLASRQFVLLHALVSRTGEPLSKDALMQAAWQDVTVGDNSLEQAIFQLRRSLDATDSNRYIETVPRRGYRFVAPVTRVTLPHGRRAPGAGLAVPRAGGRTRGHRDAGAAGATPSAPGAPMSVDAAIALAARLVASGDVQGTTHVVADALASAPPGNAGWLLPIEPLLGVQRDRAAWAAVLSALRMRAG